MDVAEIGFQPLPASHVIDDRRRCFADDTLPPGFRPVKNAPEAVENSPAVRLQWACKIDTSIVLPLANLPPGVAEKGKVAAFSADRSRLKPSAL